MQEVHIHDTDGRTDPKRLQEATRYILESLTALKFIENSQHPPRVVFLHGPLQSSYETYDEHKPNCVPAVNKVFLDSAGLTQRNIEANIHDIPSSGGVPHQWNGCISVYAYIMKKIFASKTPVVGVVERASSNAFALAVLNQLVQEKVITRRAMELLRNEIQRYAVGDEFLFGCILDEGEYLAPLKIAKNHSNRAHDNWRPVVRQFPETNTTILKTHANNFPFRVEMSFSGPEKLVRETMSLLYHTSLLLPEYAFPVGLDIADKYAKIPDWLSKGISARLTASILSKTLQTGDDRLLRQIRQLLARSPRDFFFRPKA